MNCLSSVYDRSAPFLLVILSGVEGSDNLSRDHDYWVYMMNNKTRSTLYVGVTNDLLLRVAQHRRGEIPGFTRDYHCTNLVYCSHFRDIRDAVAWEKQLKGWRRSKKNALVERDNPHWKDLAADWF